MKSKVTGISPEGATVARADGSAVNVGDEVDDEPLTVTIPSNAGGGTVRLAGNARPTLTERVGHILTAPLLVMRLSDNPEPLTVNREVALPVGDTATPARTSRAAAGTPPAVKVNL